MVRVETSHITTSQVQEAEQVLRPDTKEASDALRASADLQSSYKQILQGLIGGKKLPDNPQTKTAEWASLLDRYQQELAVFLGQPQVEALGYRIKDAKARLNLAETNLKDGFDQTAGYVEELKGQKDALAVSYQDTSVRVNRLGQGKVKSGDWGLAIGKIQTMVWQARQKGQLTGVGCVLGKIFGEAQVHPGLAVLQEQISQVEEQLAEAERIRQALANLYVSEKIEGGRQVNIAAKNFWSQLDRWASQHPDRFIAHVVQYGSALSIESYLKKARLTPEAKDKFLTRARTANIISEAQFHNFSRNRASHDQSAHEFIAQELKALSGSLVESGTLAMPVMVEQVIIGTRDQLNDAVRNLKKDLSENNVKKITNRINRALYALARGLPYHDLTQLFAQDMIDRLGGNYRLRAGTFRVILNRVLYDDRQAIEIVSVLNRDDPNYY